MGRDRSRLPLRQFSARDSTRGLYPTAPTCRAARKADHGAHSRGGRGYGEHTQGRSTQRPQGAVVTFPRFFFRGTRMGPRPRIYHAHLSTSHLRPSRRYTFIASQILQNSDSAYWIISPTCILASPARFIFQFFYFSSSM